jgi:glycosyltransferase involved in cell wall biosynthesis
MDLKETLRKAEVEDRVAYLRPIPYEKVDALLRKVLAHEGIFVSPSLGESFGLSALEAMTNKVPVLLSDIECHKTLVQENSDFLYSSGDTKQAAEKIMGISRSYDVLSVQTAKLASVYSSSDFINAWERMIESFD